MPSGHDDQDRMMFAEELKAMRKKRGWTQDETGARINFSGSTIKNIESGARAATDAQARRLDEAFETSGTFQRIERRMRGVPYSAGFRPFEPYEKEARTLRTFQHTLVPGLFQIEDYAAALTKAYPEITPDVAKERIAGRMSRQSILYRDDPPPPHIWAVLDEQVLYRNVAGPAVMAAQTEHLAELARMPKITIQVIPADSPHPGLLGAFVIAELAQPPAIVYLENASTGQTAEDPDIAAEMTLLFDALRTEALTGGASLTMIEEAAQQWTERTGP